MPSPPPTGPPLVLVDAPTVAAGPGVSTPAAAAAPDNFVTAVNVLTRDLGLELPCPEPAG